MRDKAVLSHLLSRAREYRLSGLFRVLDRYCSGNVLDVGGADFYRQAASHHITHAHWTGLDANPDRLPPGTSPDLDNVNGDGCSIPFRSDSFHTVLCVQVLEHVFQPIKMVTEIARVLRPGGYSLFVVPQTAVLHSVPYHYQNFTRYWLLSAMQCAGLQIVELTPIGGAWSSLASRFLLLLVQTLRYWGTSYPEAKRGLAFYFLLPAMWLYAVISIPICLFLSLGDLVEEPNNHLCVARKPAR